MKDFAYVAARSIGEAVRALAEHGDRARVLAGGTDLLVQLREGEREADVVVDVKRIPELMELSFTRAGGLRLGAAVPCTRIHRDERVAWSYPALTDAARILGGWQIQSRASVGGNFCNASPAADSVPPAIVEGASCLIEGLRGRRSVPAGAFCTGPGTTVLERGEILVALEFPPPRERSGSRYLRFIPREEMDIAVAGAAAWVRLDPGGEVVEEARLALAAVAPTAVEAAEAARWLAGQPARDESFRRAGELARRAARPITDLRGTAEFRLHLVGVLARRALEGAVIRARGGERRPGFPVSTNGKTL